MKRPLEQDYTSLAAYTRALEQYCDALAQPEQEPVAHCEAGPNYCWKCLEEAKPTYGSEEIRKLREVIANQAKIIEEHISDIRNMFDQEPDIYPEEAYEMGLEAIAYYAAPQRTWVGLTEDEIKECFKITPDQFLSWQIYKKIEAKLKEKNI